MSKDLHRHIVIIGTGFSGLCLAIRLKKAGIDSFTILEKAESLGGTWRDNTYPGAACDLPAFAYCFSFEQKTDWTRKWAPQAEILEYMEHCARKYDLYRHIRFGTEVMGGRFDAAEGLWQVNTNRSEEIVAKAVVSGVGQLSRPMIPKIAGLAEFRGKFFHSARWDHDFDFTGKKAGVIGNAASAIQFIPQIAPVVDQLYIFQRSANWMLPRGDRPYRRWEKWVFRHVPLAAKLYRWSIWARFELMFYPVIARHPWMSRMASGRALQNLREQVADPELRKILVPDYPIGGKRVLISDDYYQTLNRANVHVVTSGIDHIAPEGVWTRDGNSYPLDVLIAATGFDSTAFLAPMDFEGLDHRSLQHEWSNGARAYLGISVAGFPNFFMMYGPNTNLGHNSIIFMIECQSEYILQCITTLFREDLAYIDLRRDVMEAFNYALEEELGRTAWAVTGKSWYKTADGKITNNWPGTTLQYWLRTRKVDLSLYHCVPRSAARPLVAHLLPSHEASAA